MTFTIVYDFSEIIFVSLQSRMVPSIGHFFLLNKAMHFVPRVILDSKGFRLTKHHVMAKIRVDIIFTDIVSLGTTSTSIMSISQGTQ